MSDLKWHEFREQVRDAAPIEDVCRQHGAELTPNGAGRLIGLCPFHADHDPSLTIYAADQRFHCFGCGAHGDIFDLVQRFEGMSFAEALATLADRAGLAMPSWTPDQQAAHAAQIEERRRIEDLWARAVAHWHAALPDDVREAWYRSNYGFADGTIDELKLGFADGNLAQTLIAEGLLAGDLVRAGLAVVIGGELRDLWVGRLVFPYWRNGRVVYMAARAAHTLLITEGLTDAIAANQAGLACISPATTQFRTQDHGKLLQLTRRAKRVIICNDSEDNQSGEQGALETAKLLDDAGIDVRIAELPRPKGVEKVDVCEFLRDEGAEAFAILTSLR